MLDLVEISALAPVIVKARTNGADTGLELLDLVGAGTDGRGEILCAFLQDLEVEGAKGDRKVRVRRGQDGLHLIVVDLLPLLYHRDQRRGVGNRVRAEVTVHRIDDVVGGQGFAVMEFNALADLEGPLGSRVIRQNLFSQLGLVSQFLGQAGQRAIEHPAAEVVDGRCVESRVERIVRTVLVTCEYYATATLRRVGPGIGDTGKQRTGGGGRSTGSHHVVHEVATADALLDHVEEPCAVSWAQRFEHGIIALFRHKSPLCLTLFSRCNYALKNKNRNMKKSDGSTAGRGENIKNTTNCSGKDPLIRACQTEWVIYQQMSLKLYASPSAIARTQYL